MQSRSEKRWSEEDIEFLKNNYCRKNIDILCDSLGRTEKSIRNKAIKLCITSYDRRKYELDETSFSNISELSSYYAGFIAADGCILNRKNSNHASLSVYISLKDLVILENLSKFLKSNYPITKLPDIGKHCMCRLEVKSNKLCDDLSTNFLITPRKTFTLKIPNLEDNFLQKRVWVERPRF